MQNFLRIEDDLSRLINAKANELLFKNQYLILEQLTLPGISDYYFNKHHNTRPFFSIQTSAELLYRSLKMVDKPIEEIVIMDYGAGIGNLYLLAKMIGCKQVIYNDIVEDMCKGAQIVAEELGIHIDMYIHADHKGTLKILDQEGIKVDIILSRNVIEHIYDLRDFYSDMYRYQPDALLYFSTTANYHNPVNRVYHRRIHKKFEKNDYGPKRKKIIEARFPDMSEDEISKITTATRGYAMSDLASVLDRYEHSRTLPDPSAFGTNTCDPENGVWVENLLTFDQYRSIIETVGYQMEIEPAFWDTHNASVIKNIVGKTLNKVGQLFGRNAALATTAFIYIIAYRKHQ